MFKPVSTLTYKNLNDQAQALVVMNPCGPPPMEVVLDRWRSRAVAAIHDSRLVLRDVVRDLLANPQLRAIVFEPGCDNRDVFRAFWAGETAISGVDDEHVALVRGFVDLYDEDFGFRGPQQPFWPSRIMYLQ